MIKTKDIYVIENLKNGKKYVGQSTDGEKRIKNHIYQLKNNRHENRKLQNSWNLHGEDCFTFYVIGNFENYNQVEKDYIEKFNSIEDGYNILEGGEEPPIWRGEEHPLSKHSKEEIEKTKDLIKNTDLSFEKIASIMGYTSGCTISAINIGTAWFDENEEYPLRKDKRAKIAEEIIKLLKTTSMSQKAIAEQLGVSRTLVTMINIGKNHYSDLEEYPLRKNTKKLLTEEQKEEIRSRLKNGESSVDLAKEFNLQERHLREWYGSK